MNQIQTIPLAKLKQSPLNVRKTGGKKVEELAASIRASGLQQNLGVVPDGKGYGVVFGGRRLRALQALAKAGELPDTLADGVPCRVLTAEEAQEASLAENTIREAMSPLDQFTAFQALVEEGRDTAEVAARFGVTETAVKQRLRLARVSPKLLQAYGAGEMKLEQLQAFAITDDHGRQETHWKQAEHSPYYGDPQVIRRSLLQQEVSRHDRRVEFVGVETYKAAGGRVRSDLFSDEVVLEDVALLDQLVEARLEEAAELLRAEGWSWVEIGGERPAWGHAAVDGTELDLGPPELAEMDAIEANAEPTVAELVRLCELQDAVRYSDEERAKAGARVRLGNGGLVVYRGLLREGEEPPAKGPEQEESGPAAVQTVQVGTHERAVKVPGQPSFSAVQRLQAEATAIVQAQLAEAPHMAMALLVARLAADLYSGYGGPRRWVYIGREASGRAGAPLRAAAEATPAGARMAELESQWQKALPAKAADLPRWAMEQTPQVLQGLLAFLIAREIDAVDFNPGAKDGVVELADVAGVDLAAEWTPTEEWLSTLPKPVIVAMATDAVGAKRAEHLAKLKKDELPAAALPLFPAGWLPPALRREEAPKKQKAARGKAAAAGDAA